MRLGRSGSLDLPDRLEALDGALGLADGRLPSEHVADGHDVVAKANGRLRHGTTHTLVALLGATGSGKSSIANALIGSDVATTGVRRPTTSSTLGCFWGQDDAQPLLDWLEVANRYRVTDESNQLDGLLLLDVPDHDSGEVSHRLEMERIAALADMLIWVTDAEKYADKAMHVYLRQLSSYGAVTALVLNKIDLLKEEEVATCVTDLDRLLTGDGMVGAPVLAVSATTGQGIAELRDLLTDAVSKQAAMVERLQADSLTTARRLLDDLGPDEGADNVPDRVSERLAGELVAASGIKVVTDAVSAGHRRDASAKVGWPFTRWARNLRPHPLRRLHLGRGSGGRSSVPELSGVQRARSENAVRQALTTMTADLPDPWPDLVRSAGSPDQAQLNSRLDTVVSETVRDTHEKRQPLWWNVANIAQLAFAVAAVVGAVWLALLAFGAYLRLPEVPTPDYRGIPYPTGLLIGGVILGLLLAALFRQLAAVGAKRRAAVVRRRAEDAVIDVSRELIVKPVEQELDVRRQLRGLLTAAGGGS